MVPVCSQNISIVRITNAQGLVVTLAALSVWRGKTCLGWPGLVVSRSTGGGASTAANFELKKLEIIRPTFLARTATLSFF